MKVVLIDDEPKALQSLNWEIENLCQDISVVAMFDNAKLALSYLNRTKDISCIFLDIEMPEMDGFQLLNKIVNRNFELIITTASDHYIEQSYREDVLDFLLKPIDSDDLKDAIKKVKEKRQVDAKVNFQENLELAIQKAQPSHTWIELNNSNTPIILKTADILYCSSHQKKTIIHKVNNESDISSLTLQELENMLPITEFLRVNHTLLVNLTKVSFYDKVSQNLKLHNGPILPIYEMGNS